MAYDETPAHLPRIGVPDDRDRPDRPPRRDVVGHPFEFRVARAVDRLDEHVENSAAGEAGLERLVVADPVAPQHRDARLDYLRGEFVDRAFDTAAGYRSHRRAVGPAQQGSAHRTWCRLHSAHDSGQTGCPAGSPVLDEFGHDFLHAAIVTAATPPFNDDLSIY